MSGFIVLWLLFLIILPYIMAKQISMAERSGEMEKLRVAAMELRTVVKVEIGGLFDVIFHKYDS